MNPSPPQRETVERLAEEFVERYRRGERPPLSEYVERYPEHAEQIRDLFPALVLMEQIAPDRDGSALSSLEALPKQQPGEHPEQIGDYRILREIGRGGMGIVYEAEQVSLGRHVALKVLPQQMPPNPKHRQRFEREAQAAARLHHSNIVPVFGVGEEGACTITRCNTSRGWGWMQSWTSCAACACSRGPRAPGRLAGICGWRASTCRQRPWRGRCSRECSSDRPAFPGRSPPARRRLA
jgi:hypothetical protein